MVKKEKEDERIEKIIRSLLKLPENRRCINCNNLGPQYVCTTFLTFVCTNCSGVHREFTHRIKSVSMAKFSTEEVSALQAGGNERARQIYFKEWDAQRNSNPDGSNLHRLRDFIKHVYVERKYTGERSHDKLRKLRVGESDEPYGGRKSGIFYGRSPSYAITRSPGLGLTKCPSYEVTRSPRYEVTRSPSFEDRRYVRDRYGSSRRSADINFQNYYDEMRSPYQPESSRYKRSPVRFEVVDDRYRDDECRNEKPPESVRSSRKDLSSASGRRSHDSQNVPSIQVEKRFNTNDEKEADVSACNKSTTPSSTKAATYKIPLEGKNQNSESLIDFNNDPTSNGSATPPQAAEKHPSTDNSVGSSIKKEPLPPKPNTVEFLLFELSIPPVTPSSNNVSDVDRTHSLTSSEGYLTDVNVFPTSNTSEGVPTNNDGPSTVESARNMSVENVPTTESLEQMSVVPYQGPAPTSVLPSERYEGITVRPSTMSVGQISESFNNTNASTVEFGNNKFTEGYLGATAYKQSLSLFDGFNTTSIPSVVTNLHVEPSNGSLPKAPSDLIGGSSFIAQKNHKVEMQDEISTKPSTTDNSTRQGHQLSIAVGEIRNQPCTSSKTCNERKPATTSAETSQQISQARQEPNFGIKKPSTTSETKSTQRKELPMDLFASSFMPNTGPAPNWHISNPYNMGFGTQHYHSPMAVMAYPNPIKSTNPFDFNNDDSQKHSPSFGSTGDLRGAVFDVPPRPVLFPSSSMGHMSSAMISDTSQIPSQSFPFQSTKPSGPYIDHQAYINDGPSRWQGGGFGDDEDPFASFNAIQQIPGANSYSARQNSFPSRGGNPFG